ncbi:19903_t:CDS:2 [Rhizophagus irregularis]|nr:19903_t:CDS:2 [Rhizophagus irregularis]
MGGRGICKWGISSSEISDVVSLKTSGSVYWILNNRLCMALSISALVIE